MVAIKYTGDELWARIERAEQQARDRLDRVAEALDRQEIPYVAVGELAVQFWVAVTDRTALRNAREVDIVLGQDTFRSAIDALKAIGFVHCPIPGKEMLLDESAGRVRIYIAATDSKQSMPTLDDYQVIFGVRVALLESLARMMLSSFTILERLNLLDMLGVGLIDSSWLSRFDIELRLRLQELIDTPDG
jgi:hypothetical protein